MAAAPQGFFFSSAKPFLFSDESYQFDGGEPADPQLSFAPWWGAGSVQALLRNHNGSCRNASGLSIFINCLPDSSALHIMASVAETAKQEPASTATLSSIPQKRAVDEVHSPARPSPLNPDVKFADPPSQTDDDGQASRSKPSRMKKETLKKREAKADSIPPTPDPKVAENEVEQSESSPLRYKLAPPKLSDFDPPRGPVLTLHHEAIMCEGDAVEFFETSDQ